MYNNQTRGVQDKELYVDIKEGQECLLLSLHYLGKPSHPNHDLTLCCCLHVVYHVVAVGSRPLSFQSGWHLQSSILLPVGPAGSTQTTLHVGGTPRVPLVRAGGYTHREKEDTRRETPTDSVSL